MPIYEFICTQCGQDFEELLRLNADVSKVVCPRCSSQEVRKRLSIFSSLASSSGGSTGQAFTAPSCSPGGT